MFNIPPVQSTEATALYYEPALQILRSKDWQKFRNEIIAAHPFCSVCGSKVNLTVHHIKPYHLFPELELVADNCMVLCEGTRGYMDQMNCHLVFGHKGNWKLYIPNPREIAALIYKELNQ